MALSMDSILKLSTSRKLLILIAILFVMAGLYFYSVFMPQHEELNGLRAELNKLVLQVNENKKVTKLYWQRGSLRSSIRIGGV